MVTVGEALRLWDRVDKDRNVTDQGIEFHRLLSETALTAKLPSKTSRLRSKILTVIGAVERVQKQSGEEGVAKYMQTLFVKPNKKHKKSKTKGFWTDIKIYLVLKICEYIQIYLVLTYVY